MHVVILETLECPASSRAGLRDRLAPLRTQFLRRRSALRGRARRTRAHFHGRHRVVASSLPKHRIPFGYDAAGNRNAEMDARANTTYYLYDVGNRLANVIDPLGKVAYYGYDANSNLTQTVDNNLTFIYFGYDALDRSTRILYTDGGYGVQPYGNSPYGGLFVAQYFEYDAAGNLSSTLDEWGGSYFGYDTLNRLNKRSTPRVDAVYYGYDAVSNLTRLQYPQGLNACYYGYDAAQRMSQLRAPTDNSCYYAYDASSNVARKLFGNAMAGYFTYDAAERVSSIRYVKSDGTPIVYFDYARDVAGRILTIGRENDLAIYYAYDNIDRLTRETWRKKSDNSQVYAFSYSYDATGNRLQSRYENAGAESQSSYFAYAADNSMTKRMVFMPPSTTVDTYYTYDANGSLIKEYSPSPAAATYFEYGPHGFITKITPPTGNPWNFYYDGQLNRYRIDRGGTDSYFLWDGLNLLEERDGSGNLVARYTHGYTRIPGIGSIVEIYKPGTPNKTYYLAMDHRGSAYVISDESQTEIGRRQYDAFGRVLSQTGTWPVDVGYQSGWLELSISGRRLLFSPSRLYDPETGRFLGRDPLPSAAKVVSASSGSVMGVYARTKFASRIIEAVLSRQGLSELRSMNLYLYSANCPVSWLDLLGLMSVDGNSYGDWNILQMNSNGNGAGGWYSSEVLIKWNPKSGCCTQIDFIQTVRIVDAANPGSGLAPNEQPRATPNFTAVDSIKGSTSAFTSIPLVPSRTPGSFPPPLSATTHDTPSDKVPNRSWFFETCAICRSGVDKGLIYACLKWGFDVNAMNNLTSHVPMSSDRPSGDFMQAVPNWNRQAAGPAAQQNAPGQRPIPPLIPQVPIQSPKYGPVPVP
jgi:YD repeat-containing protein